MELLVAMLLWLGVTASVGVVVEALTRREAAARSRPGSPRCGECGYIVVGLPGMRCPEWGGDLRVVGVVRP